MKRRVSTEWTALSNNIAGLGGVDWEYSAVRPSVESLRFDCNPLGESFPPDTPVPGVKSRPSPCGEGEIGLAGGDADCCENDASFGFSELCVVPMDAVCIAACSGGGTVVAPVDKPHRCDSSDRSQGIAATAMRIRASRMGSLFLIAPICTICRIFQRFAL